MQASSTNKPRIVLAGGGHAHVLALLTLAADCRVTLVSEAPHAAYSGMFPGHLCGVYQQDECFIHLEKLAQRLGVEWRQGSICGIDDKHLLLDGGEAVAFDVLSLNTGAHGRVLFDSADVCCVKPMTDFMRWRAPLDGESFDALVIIGAGAGGVEIAFSLARRWRDKNPAPRITLIGRQLLPSFPESARRRCRDLLAARGIQYLADTALDFQNGQLRTEKSGTIAADKIITAAGVSAPQWLKNTPLALAQDGFVRINERLQSVSHPDIFAAGDVAAHPAPLPKAGVMATRQSGVLAANLRARADNKALTAWTKRGNPLYILNTADGKALASYCGLSAHGHWAWVWKNYLDTRFMNKFIGG